MKKEVKLSSPWVAYVRKLQALFGADQEINIAYNQDENEVKLYVANNDSKADALTRLLPTKKEFGNVILKITVVPANDKDISTLVLFSRAFEGNPVLADLEYIDSEFGRFGYVIFQNKVVQFFNDCLDDPHGNESTLYQEIAKDVFKTEPGIYYCTEESTDE